VKTFVKKKDKELIRQKLNLWTVLEFSSSNNNKSLEEDELSFKAQLIKNFIY